MPTKLTDATVKAAKAENGKRLVLIDTKGLRLRVTPSGVKTWSVSFRASGVRRTYSLGRYPKVSLSDARDKAAAALGRVAEDRDPRQEQIEARVEMARKAKERPATVAALVAECIESLPLRPATRREWERLLRREIKPALGHYPAEALPRAEVRRWLARMAKRAPVVANRALELLRRSFTWGVSEDRVSASPIVGISKPSPKTESDRVLGADEIQAVVRAAVRLRPAWRTHVDVLFLLLLTGVRESMALGIRRSEIQDIDGSNARWTIPGGFGGRTKNKRPHVVPLVGVARAIVAKRCKAVDTDLLFPAARRGPWIEDPSAAPMRWQSAFTRALRAEADTVAKATLPHWRVHNLRHTLATHLREDLRTPRDVVALTLGHVQPGATRIYDRAEKLDERRAALVAWEAWLGRIVRKQRKGAEVVALAR